MSTVTEKPTLPENFYLLHDDADADSRPNRLCVCLSDVHFTDGTVGNQSAEAVVWDKVFDSIVNMCKDKENDIKELTLVLVGDVVDMIRTARWAQNEFYPWQRADDPKRFKKILKDIMKGIITKHTQAPSLNPDEKTGFFYFLQELPQRLESQQCAVQTLVLLGNHDKEIFADDEILKMFYEQCLGQSIQSLSPAYRRWIGKMYFNDASHYDDPRSVPRLPFYWGDQGFRLFVTHGQWRDDDNSCRIKPQQGKPGWQVKNGWRPDIWQKIDYAPFTQSCFGDTVAAGLLSGFIDRTKKRLDELETALTKKEKLAPQGGQEIAREYQEIARLKRILDELDLYRPTYAAVQRIIKEIWRLRGQSKPLTNLETIIEEELLDSIYTWLSWDFTLASATPSRRSVLRIARMFVGILKRLGARIELGFLYSVMWVLNRLQQGIFFHKDDPSYREMRRFPGFLKEFRDCGFRIHGEGHTHIPLQDELDFDKPEGNPNYTYINFGTWRDQIVLKQKKSYRRRGVGRVLSVIDLAAKPDSSERGFVYWVEDVLHWGDQLDRL